MARRLQSNDSGLDVIHPQAAGIDVGNASHYVAMRPNRDPEPVRRFECFTADLHRLADWLNSCGVTTVAMQSTGVYWIPLYDILEERGFEMYLGQRAPHQESAWAQKRCAGVPMVVEVAHVRIVKQLFSANQPDPSATDVLAATTRTRASGAELHPADAESPDADERAVGQCDQRPERVDRAVDCARHRGWRTRSHKLAQLRDPRIRASPEEVAKSLEGNWRPELLFLVNKKWTPTPPTRNALPSVMSNCNGSLLVLLAWRH